MRFISSLLLFAILTLPVYVWAKDSSGQTDFSSTLPTVDESEPELTNWPSKEKFVDGNRAQIKALVDSLLPVLPPPAGTGTANSEASQ